MTFFEQLKQKADNIEHNINIQDKINFIKKEMESCAHKRSFTISLVQTTSTIALGHGRIGRADFFVPKGLSPDIYRNIFIEELLKLGFDKSNMHMDEDIFAGSTVIYNIHIRW
jgi:hypothetical protein